MVIIYGHSYSKFLDLLLKDQKLVTVTVQKTSKLADDFELGKFGHTWSTRENSSTRPSHNLIRIFLLHMEISILRLTL